jgi:hypothetical protein
VMTTDLSHGRPWRLPSPYQQGQDILEQGGGLLFKPKELRRYFPDAVVRHLEEVGAPISARRAALLPDGGRAFRRFPIGPDLPVVVATRMSLSFPGLISAVPLWNLDFEDEPPRLERVVFSDGGITSNFPVHFFDAPLPRRPTFGLHLSTFPPGEQPPVGEQAQDRAVVPPPPVEGRAPEEPRQIVTLGQFFVAIKDAMQNWRDNAQARQPGFRDRMVHIRLGPQEGGLNLTMDRQKVLDLSARGGAAARVLIGRFAQPAAGTGVGTAWNDHRFVRFRITMAVLEEYLGSFGTAWSQAGDAVTVPYPTRVAAGTVRPYQFTLTQRTQALLRAGTYDLPVPEDPAQRLTRGAPRPPSVLRIVPPT